MNLADINQIKTLLSEEGFSFKKSLGQNFLIDETVCPEMAAAACDKNTGVIEIGPGAGVLTVCLAEEAKKVVAIELDERLRPVLKKTVGGYANTEVVFADVMKTDLNSLIAEKFADCEKIAVCANLPYYITSPVIMSLLKQKLPIESVTAMVQKEAAIRLCAEVGTREAGAVTAAVQYFSEPEILFDVNRTCFIPIPGVDSAVIKLKIRKNPPVKTNDEKMLFAVVKACFAQRRKTLLNTISNTMGIDKNSLKEYLIRLGLDPAVRGESLTFEQIAALSDMIGENNG